jgi:hypothetical protein
VIREATLVEWPDRVSLTYAGPDGLAPLAEACGVTHAATVAACTIENGGKTFVQTACR